MCAVIVRFRFIISRNNKGSPIGTPEHIYPTLPLPRFTREGSTPCTSTLVRGQTPLDITDLVFIEAVTLSLKDVFCFSLPPGTRHVLLRSNEERDPSASIPCVLVPTCTTSFLARMAAQTTHTIYRAAAVAPSPQHSSTAVLFVAVITLRKALHRQNSRCRQSAINTSERNNRSRRT